MTRKRKVRLIADAVVGKAWAATVALGGYDAWVSIDAIGDFLRKRQIDAASVQFADRDPNTRYAIPTTLLRKKGWEDGTIARALSLGVDYEFLEIGRKDGTNVFRAKKDHSTSLWKIQDTSVPTSPTWALPRANHV
jgi:hypothetical protein